MQLPGAISGVLQSVGLAAPSGPLGANGLPRAKPFFPVGDVNNLIRHTKQSCCDCICVTEPGPHVPAHWYDAGSGWATFFFYDVEPFSWGDKKNGTFRCQARNGMGQQCNHEVGGRGCCDGTPCWCPLGNAPSEMAVHLVTAHGMQPTMPSREFATGLCDTEGCLDVWCCAPCQGSRQIMAIRGHQNTFDACWCAYLVLMGCRTVECGDRTCCYYLPPHWFIALLTRYHIVKLNGINEGCCETNCKICFCAPCSVAQTYRELTAAGVWPGGNCNAAPAQTALYPAPFSAPMGAAGNAPFGQTTTVQPQAKA